MSDLDWLALPLEERQRIAEAYRVRSEADGFAALSVAPPTAKAYKTAWKKWEVFAFSRRVSVMPPTAADLEAYLVLKIAPKRSVAVLDGFSASVAWMCGLSGFDSPLTGKRVSLVMRGMRSAFRVKRKPRLPFTRSHIRRFMRFARRSGSLVHWRAAVVLTASFQDFLRFAEMAHMKLEDISLSEHGLVLKVRQAKNHRVGFESRLPVERGRLNSVGAFVLEYLEKFLLWEPGMAGALCAKVSGRRLDPRSEVSYSVLHKSCKVLIKCIGLEPELYGTQSSKRGAATQAARAGCSSAEVNAMGRWHCMDTGLLYVHDGPDFRRDLSARFST
jgi:hypothetical protein